MKLDEIDHRLLKLLQTDCKQPIKELAQKLNLTIGPVHERIKKLERNGVVKNYVALVDRHMLDRGLITFCAVSVEKHTIRHLEEFEQAIQQMKEVLECYTIAGGYDYLLKILAKDMESYQEFIVNKLSRLETVANVNSQFVIKEVKYATSIER